ncbi:MAG: hypothetical protein FJW20_22265 [Acidimicrobiia bacterium]|nr:hypothetical protein [Acidimicrobiia bacterium]
MAASPIIIDDGGSTRIKQILAASDGRNMDHLLGPAHHDLADGRFPEDSAAEPKCRVLVVNIDVNGNNTAPDLPFLGSGDHVEINSTTQKVRVDLNKEGKVRLSISAVEGQSPIVEARQLGNQRRYIVRNARTITSISLNGKLVFEPPPNSVYTMVRLD